MINRQFVNVALLLWGGLFCLMAAFCLSLGEGYNRTKRRWLMCAQLAAGVLLLSDGLGWYTQGTPGILSRNVMYITNFIVYAGLFLVLLMFHRYICCYLLDSGTEKAPLCARMVEGICTCGVVLVIIAQFSDLFYYIDDQNIYHRSDTFPVAMVLLAAGMMLEFCFILSRRKNLTRGRFIVICACVILPVAASASQIIGSEISLVDLSIGVMMILLFVVATTTQNRELAQAERTKNQIRERLEIATILNRCVEKLSAGNTVDEGLKNLLETVNGYFCADRTYLFEIDFDRNVLVNTYEWVRGGEVSAQKDNLQEVPLEVIAVWMESFRKARVYYMPDLEQEKGRPSYEMLKQQQVWRLLAVPLLREDEVIGFLGVDNPTCHYEDATLLASIQFFITNSLERRKQQQYLRRLSYHDTLTGLYNRNRYIEVLEMTRQVSPERVGAMYVDLNGLKKVNDRQGHRAGDELIIRAARVLEGMFGENAYRVGGDEFVVLVLDTEQQAFVQKTEQLHQKLKQCGVDASIGAVWRQYAADLEQLLREADEQMYREKKQYYGINRGNE